MDNNQLQDFFNELFLENNYFNLIIKLKENEKKYKKSYFYKKTKISIYKAYIGFIFNKAIINIKNIYLYKDPEQLVKLINNYIQQLNNIDLTGIINTNELLDLDELYKLREDLQITLDNFKK